MPKATDANKLQERIKVLDEFYQLKKRMPSVAELGELLGLRSKSTVAKVITQLERLNVLHRDPQGRLIPDSLLRKVRVLGTVEAGFPNPAEEELIDTLSLDELLIENREATYLLEVSGDSMRDAGILPHDMVIVDKSVTPRDGDIVIAQVDDQWTMKYLQKEGDSVVLLPANDRYKPIRPKRELRIAGVVRGVMRKYR